MTPEGIHVVVDVEGKQVLVVGEEVFRALLSKALFWFFTAGIIYVVGLVLAWGKLVANQNAMRADLDTDRQTLLHWEVTAPAPAESTRIALQQLSREVIGVTEDLRNLRRELGKPR